MKRLLLLAIVAVIAVAVGYSHSMRQDRTLAARDYAERVGAVNAVASWSSPALTVQEVYEEADLVIRARVSNQTTRVISQDLPAYESSNPSDPTSAPRVVGMETVNLGLTNSAMEVLEVYKGTAEDQVLVMQTGMSFRGEGADPGSTTAFIDDPIYDVATEHILFLVDITDSEILSQGSKLYRIVNPAGRYDVFGKEVISLAEPNRLDAEKISLPRTLEELESQIRLLAGTHDS